MSTILALRPAIIYIEDDREKFEPILQEFESIRSQYFLSDEYNQLDFVHLALKGDYDNYDFSQIDPVFLL